MTIFDDKNNIVSTTPRCPITSFYYVDITPQSSPMSFSSRRKVQVSMDTVERVMWLHRRLYHPSRSTMAKALRSGVWEGIENITAADIERVLQRLDCIHCSLAKLNKLPINQGSGIRPNFVGQVLSVDYKPVLPASITGHTGFYLFSCCACLYYHACLVKNKTELLHWTKLVCSFYRFHGHTTTTLRVDAGTVENAIPFTTALAQIGIAVEPCIPEQQFANPVERGMQTVLKGVSTCMLDQNNLTAPFWGLCLLAWIHAHNHTPNALTEGTCPATLVTKTSVNLSTRFLYPFGTPVASSTLNRKGQIAKHGTFVERNELAFVVGSTTTNNGGSLVYIPSRGTSRIYPRKDLHVIKLAPSLSKFITQDIKLLQPALITTNNDTPITFITARDQHNHTAPVLPNIVDHSADIDSLNDTSIAVTSISCSFHLPIPQQPHTTSTSTTHDAEHTQPKVSLTDNTNKQTSTETLPTNLTTITTNPIIENIDVAPDTLIDTPPPPPPTSWTRPLTPPSHRHEHKTRQQEMLAKLAATNNARTWGSQQMRTWSHRLSRAKQYDYQLDAEHEKLDENAINIPKYLRNLRAWQQREAQKDPATKTTNFQHRETQKSKIHLPQYLQCHSTNGLQNRKKVKSLTYTVKQAMLLPDWPEYEKAIDKEYTSLDELGTGTEINPTTATSIILPTKFVLRKKRSGTYKARLVVLGNLEKRQESMFAPTANEKSLRLLLSLSVNLGWTITGYDIFGAFCQAPLERAVYVRLPNNKVWRLNKALYGLRDSPKLFYEHVSTTLLLAGYTRCSSDPCMFHIHNGQDILICCIHVDDFAVAASNEKMHEDLREALREVYEITETEGLEDFLGINIEYSGNRMYLTMPKLLNATITDFLPTDAPPAYTPMSKTFNDEQQNKSPRCDSLQYHSLLGKLIYILKVRPDISNAVCRLATRACQATTADYLALLRVLSYLKATEKFGICFSRATAATAYTLFAWADAAFNVHTDSKSHSGYCLSLGGGNNGMFYYRSFKQSNVALSSTEAELNAAVECTKEIQWLRSLLAELGYPQLHPTILYANNKSMITLCSEYSGNHKRVKHFLNRINYMLEQVHEGTIVLEHLAGEEHKADALTKPLEGAAFGQAREHLLGNQI